MFLVTNQFGTEEHFKTRDDLFFFLDTENARCQQVGEKVFVTLQQLNTSGEVIDLSNLRLPYKETLDKLLRGFGKVKENKAQPLMKTASKEVKEEKPVESPKDEPRQAISAPQESHNTFSKAKKTGLALLVLALFGLSAGLSWISHQKTKAELLELRQTVAQVQAVSDQTHSADVFVRYFLPNYYSGDQDNLEEYLAKGQQLEVETGQVMSVILEKTALKGETLIMTYVLLVKTEVGQETIRLSVPVKQDKKAKYGYTIVGTIDKDNFPK